MMKVILSDNDKYLFQLILYYCYHCPGNVDGSEKQNSTENVEGFLLINL